MSRMGNLVAAPEETRNAIHVQQLKLEQIVVFAAVEIYKATRVLWPDHPDYPRYWFQAPTHVRERMKRIAAQAIGAVNEAAEREAERLAELSLDDTLNEVERDALLLDANHSKLYLIEAAFLRFRQILQRVKPIKAALAVYRHALAKGRE